VIGAGDLPGRLEMVATRQGIGERELELLRWVQERGSCSVGEAAEGFGAAAGLARSTVQTMLERLHDKGHLERRQLAGVYRYAAAQGAGELLRGLVRSFVAGPLGGSVSPFVAFLAEKEEVSPDELAELEALVERLQERRRGEP
jgi:predicted transcriptional regulator